MSPVETGARRHLVLVGLMGAGKTTVGARCAERLGRAFVDTDDQIVMQAGMPVEEIFRTGGEDRFRAFERQVIEDVCASPVPLVIATGGGAVVDRDNRRLLRGAGIVVWLHAPTEVLVSRVGNDGPRPLLAGDPQGALARLGAARQDAYSAAADRVVETEGHDVDAVADAVLAAFAEAAGVAS
jgi:shikimate kinase